MSSAADVAPLSSLPPSDPAEDLIMVPARMKRGEWSVLKKLLRDDGLFFQKFVEACTGAYLRGDPPILRVLREWKESQERKGRGRGRKPLLSHRERKDLLDAFERGEED